MTAIFIIRRREECHLLTDGAAIDPDGRVVAIIAKAMPLPHLGVAVTLRGTVEMMTQLPLLGTAPDLSALRSRAESAVQACEGQVEVYVAGVEACFAVTAGAGVQDILGFALAPSSDAIYADLGFLWDRPPDDVDPQRDGVRVLEVARAHASAFDCGVGGFAQLTTVTRDAITTRIVRRWSDQIGNIIGV
jgi:hypothetical protein